MTKVRREPDYEGTRDIFVEILTECDLLDAVHAGHYLIVVTPSEGFDISQEPPKRTLTSREMDHAIRRLQTYLRKHDVPERHNRPLTTEEREVFARDLREACPICVVTSDFDEAVRAMDRGFQRGDIGSEPISFGDTVLWMWGNQLD